VINFIAMYSVNPVRYTRQDISKREGELGITRKVGSATANQAFSLRNLLRRRLFWTQPPPVGIFGVPRARLLDIDEAGIWLEKCVRKYGKAFKGVAVREPGLYGHGEKRTLIMGIDCAGMKYVSLRKVAGTTIDSFNDFVRDDVIALLPAGGPQRIFMWDNLAAHHSAVVWNTVTAAGHLVVFRPAYRPVTPPPPVISFFSAS
jgi:hypothetical protein